MSPNPFMKECSTSPVCLVSITSLIFQNYPWEGLQISILPRLLQKCNKGSKKVARNMKNEWFLSFFPKITAFHAMGVFDL